MVNEYLFVYGTLRSDISREQNHLLQTQAVFISVAYLQAKLYEVAGYPGAIYSKNPADKVYGELYELIDSNQILTQLDNYEECVSSFPEPHEYIRTQLPIRLADSCPMMAWVYLYNRDISTLRAIKTGDYARFLNELKK